MSEHQKQTEQIAKEQNSSSTHPPVHPPPPNTNNQNNQQFKGKVLDFSEEKIIKLKQKDKINTADFNLVSKIRCERLIYNYVVCEIKTGEKYFAKILRRNKEQNQEENYKRLQTNILNEVNFLRQIRYPTIIKYIGYSPNGFDQKHQPAILMEYVKNDLLHDVIKNSKDPNQQTGWNDTKKLINIYGITSAISYLHSINVLHRNLNPTNIYETEKLYPLVGNFENAIYLGEDIDIYPDEGNTIGLVMYVAPEIIKEQKYSRSSDIYSLGMIIYEILTGSIPFEGLQPAQISNDILQGKRPEFNSNIPEQWQRLIESCWSEDSKTRPTAKDILKFLKEDQNSITPAENIEEYKSFIKYVDDFFLNYSQEDEEEEETFEEFPLYTPVKIKRTSINNLDIMKKLKKAELVSQEKFYEVYKVKQLDSDKMNLAKVFYVSMGYYPEETRNKIKDCIKNTLKADHPSILKSIDFSEYGFGREYRPTLITEFNKNVSLQDIIIKGPNNTICNNWDATKKLINIYGIASGMSYLHSHDILHLHLTPANIIEDFYFYPKIKDFGIHGTFKDLKSILKVRKDSLYYPPEYYNINEYTKSSDVYSYSLVVYALLTNTLPFKDISNITDHINNINNNIRPKINSDIPKVYRDLIEKCWSTDPKERPTFSQIVEEIENNRDFITKDVDEKDFKYYIESIKSGNLPEDPQEAPKEKDQTNPDQNITKDQQKKEEAKIEPVQKDQQKKEETKIEPIQKDQQKKEESKIEPIQKDQQKKEETKIEPIQKDQQKKEKTKIEPLQKDQQKKEEAKIEPIQKDQQKKKESEQQAPLKALPNKFDDLFKEIDEEEDYDEEEDDINETEFYVDRVIIEFYFKKELISKGSTSTVYQTLKRGSRHKYASKIFCTEYHRELKKKPLSLSLFKIAKNQSREVNFHADFQHPLITKFEGYSSRDFDNRKNPMLVTEYAENGSLKELIEKLKKGEKIEGWNDTIRLIIIYGIALVMSYLHSQDILHRDLKPSEILLDNEFHPKLTDFGLSIKESDLDGEIDPVGTGPYIAPEIWIDSKYSKASDIYAFGILLYELMMNDFAFERKLDCQINMIVSVKKERPQFTKIIPDAYKALIESCWDDNIEKRPQSFDKIIEELKSNHGFITETVDENIYLDYRNKLDQMIKRLQQNSL